MFTQFCWAKTAQNTYQSNWKTNKIAKTTKSNNSVPKDFKKLNKNANTV